MTLRLVVMEEDEEGNKTVLDIFERTRNNLGNNLRSWKRELRKEKGEGKKLFLLVTHVESGKDLFKKEWTT